MTSCNGCGKALGFKKYRFKKLLRIPGNYCKDCMVKVGQDWDNNGKITLPKRTCALCESDFFFLKSAWQGKKQKKFCDVCYQVAIGGVIVDKTNKGQAKARLPVSMLIIGGLGALLMVLGLIFTLMSTPSGEMNLLNILFGATTTAVGFLLVRKTMKNKKLLAGY
jgi:hypothetical protein